MSAKLSVSLCLSIFQLQWKW